MTRAKQNLTIHYNANYFCNINVEKLRYVKNTFKPVPPKHLILHLMHKHINLWYFQFVQSRLNLLKSGDSLRANEEGLVNSFGEQIVKFSQAFQEERKLLANEGFQLVQSKIRFILLWKINKENTDYQKEIKIVLPELHFEK